MGILLADSGSTKTDWALIDERREVQSFKTKGMNPYLQTKSEICDELTNVLLPRIGEEPISAIYFYGAGCVFDKAEMLKEALISQLRTSNVEVNTDLLGAARGACGRSAGIACILGTGSNSCYYDGERIIKNISPLGFILGDEGGGAVLGRMLLGDILKEVLSLNIRQQFMDRYEMTQAEILDRVYKQPFPNRFLAGFSPFVKEFIHEPEIRAMVKSNFKRFFRRNVKQYDYKQNLAHTVGSIGYYYKDILIEAAEEENVKLGTIIKSPLEGLIKYYGI